MSTHLELLVSGAGAELKYWSGESAGDETRITTGKYGKHAKSDVQRHPDARQARAFVEAQAGKARKKGFGPLAVGEAPSVPVLVVPRGVHAHEGARALVHGKELLCGLCGGDVTAVEISAQRLPAALLPALAFPTHDLDADLKRAAKLVETLAGLAVGSCWESRSLVSGKPKAMKKAAEPDPAEAATREVFRQVLDRTAKGEALVDVLAGLLHHAPMPEAVATARLAHGSQSGMRPVEAFNPAVVPTASLLWRHQQFAIGQRSHLLEVADRTAFARALLGAAHERGGELAGTVGLALIAADAWDWLGEEDHRLGRELLSRNIDRMLELEAAGLSAGSVWPLSWAGVTDVESFWSRLERLSPASRDALFGALGRSRWPDGAAKLIQWLNSNPYDAPQRSSVTLALNATGHPDLASFALGRLGTPDGRGYVTQWIPSGVHSHEEWQAFRAREPWPYRSQCAALQLQVDGGHAAQSLSKLAWQLWSATGQFIPRRDLDGSPLDATLLGAWRDELVAASLAVSIAPLEGATAAAPDASAHQKAEAEERSWHASLHHRAQELVARLTGPRLAAAWVGALEPGPGGTRHRSALFSRAMLDAVQADPSRCGPEWCSWSHEKRSIDRRLNAALLRTLPGQDVHFGIELGSRPLRRANWELFRNSRDARLDVPITFVLWDLETYLADFASAGPGEPERLIELLALFDDSLAAMVSFDPELRFPSVARHLTGDEPLRFIQSVGFHAHEQRFRSGFPGFGLLRGIPPFEVELVLRALLAPPFFHDRDGHVGNALIGGEGLAAFRSAPVVPFPRLFRDVAEREAIIDRLPRAPAQAPRAAEPQIAPRLIEFKCAESSVQFNFSGPKSEDWAETLLEHATIHFPRCTVDRKGDVATLQSFEGLGLSGVMDHLLHMSDSAAEDGLDPALRDAVEDAVHADGLVIEVRS